MRNESNAILSPPQSTRSDRHFDLGKEAAIGAAGLVVWLTGLPSAGKSTLAALLAQNFQEVGATVDVLDGDEIRAALSPTLGFSAPERELHNRRVAWIAGRLAQAGVCVFVATISPSAESRRAARKLVEAHTRFVEVFVATPLDECIRRDPKGLYERALAGEIREFTGISAAYEEPDAADIVVTTIGQSPAESTAVIMGRLDALSVGRPIETLLSDRL